MPTGSAVPRASRRRPASSTAAQRSSPATRTRISRRRPSSSTSQWGAAAGSTLRAATSAAVIGPSIRTRSATPSSVASGPLRHQTLQLGLGPGQSVRVEQVAQAGALAAPEQLAQQGRVQREGGGPALGQRGVALVEERPRRSRRAGSGRRARESASPPRRPGPGGRPDPVAAQRVPARRRRPAGTRAPSPARSGTTRSGWPPAAAGRPVDAAATAAGAGRGGGGAAAAPGRRTPGTARRTAPSRRPRP